MTTNAAKVLQDQDEFKFPDEFVRQVMERHERKANQEKRMQQQAETLELKRAGTAIERERETAADARGKPAAQRAERADRHPPATHDRGPQSMTDTWLPPTAASDSSAAGDWKTPPFLKPQQNHEVNTMKDGLDADQLEQIARAVELLTHVRNVLVRATADPLSPHLQDILLAAEQKTGATLADRVANLRVEQLCAPQGK